MSLEYDVRIAGEGQSLEEEGRGPEPGVASGLARGLEEQVFINMRP